MANSKIDRDRLRALYAATPAAKFERHARNARILYGGGHGSVVTSFVDRFVARHHDDPDLVAMARKGAPLLESFLAKRGVSEEDARAFTSGLLERDQFPRSDEAKKALNDRNYDLYRKEVGGFENAEPGIKANTQFWNALRAEVPFFGNRGVDQGAHLDLPMVRVGAKLGAPPK